MTYPKSRKQTIAEIDRASIGASAIGRIIEFAHIYEHERCAVLGWDVKPLSVSARTAGIPTKIQHKALRIIPVESETGHMLATVADWLVPLNKHKNRDM